MLYQVNYYEGTVSSNQSLLEVDVVEHNNVICTHNHDFEQTIYQPFKYSSEKTLFLKNHNYYDGFKNGYV